MKTRCGVIVLGLFLTGCGGGGDGGASASAGGQQQTIRLTNAETGNGVRDGSVEVYYRSQSFVVSLGLNGSCCSMSVENPRHHIANGTTNDEGRFTFSFDPATLPEESTLLTIVREPGVPPDYRLNADMCCNYGYFIFGDGPGFASRTIKVSRSRIVDDPSAITVTLAPL